MVTRLGFRPDVPNVQAVSILDRAAEDLAQLVVLLVQMDVCNPETSLLVLSGALMSLAPFRSLVLQKLAQRGLDKFESVSVIDIVSNYVAQYLSLS